MKYRSLLSVGIEWTIYSSLCLLPEGKLVMRVNYQIYDKDFTCATPVFQRSHWGISCCDPTSPGEVNILVTRTTVWCCTARYTLPAHRSPSPGPRQRGPCSLVRAGERLHHFAAFPVSVFGCRCKPCIWRQQRHEQELIWLSTSRAKATPGLEKSQRLSYWKPELRWCPLPRWIV